MAGKKVRSLTARTSCIRPRCKRFAYQSPSRVFGLAIARSSREPLRRVSNRCVQRRVYTWRRYPCSLNRRRVPDVPPGHSTDESAPRSEVVSKTSHFPALLSRNWRALPASPAQARRALLHRRSEARAASLTRWPSRYGKPESRGAGAASPVICAGRIRPWPLRRPSRRRCRRRRCRSRPRRQPAP